ncbi:uncharacterized protein LOC131931349 [Physella acuta]|uniref:uncharacterized protein LOC131931349 n=1 Tax=Physella acuta TaxID=109671 RepID=UPI0027DD189A|nr:uncharacterized protein LOC131931349 [Physella acuta]
MNPNNTPKITSENGDGNTPELLVKSGSEETDVLTSAACNGQYKTVQLLIDSGVDINCFGNNGMNALITASLNGHHEIVELLIKNGAEINGRIEKNGRNALMIASKKGHDKTVKILIECGTDVNNWDTNGINALMVASQNGHYKTVKLLVNCKAEINHVGKKGINALISASCNGHESIAKLLIKCGADINHFEANEMNALMYASQNGHDKIVEFLIQSEAEINHFEKNGCSALMLASQNGHEKTVNLLIRSGADLNIVDTDRTDALMIASHHGHFKIVELLIQHGADINRVETDGYDALMLASKQGYYEIVDLLVKCGSDINRFDLNGWNALMLASENGHLEIVKLLIKCGSDANRTDSNGIDALILASENGHLEIVKLLIKCGSDVNRIDPKGCDPLMLASENGHYKIVKLLIKCGADINRNDSNGSDAFMLACEKGHEKIAKLLLKCGSDVNRVETDGLDALMLASKNGHDKIVDLLLRKKADFHWLKATGGNELDNTPQIGRDDYVEDLKSSFIQYLLNLICLAFEESHTIIINTILVVIESYNGKSSLTSQVQVQAQAQAQAEAVAMVVLAVGFGILNFAELLENVSYVMAEFSRMQKLDAFQFFFCQKSLSKLYWAISEKGSDNSSDFALCLAKNSTVEIFSEHIILNNETQSSQSQFVTYRIIIILHNIARRKQAKILLCLRRIKNTLMEIRFQDAVTSLIAKMLLSVIVDDADIIITTSEEIHGVMRYIKEASEATDKMHNGVHLSELLQGLAKFAKHPPACEEILPLLDTLKDFLGEEDLEELEYTTECLKEMSQNVKASKNIITSPDFTDRLTTLNKSENIDITGNVNSIFWRSGRTTGILPSQSDKVLSDDFPKEFTIETDTLGQGAFGSVHLVTDKNNPEDKTFVAKRLYFHNETDVEVCKHEARILLKTKHRRIVQFHGFQRKKDEFFIFMEYLKHGTLESYISLSGNLNEKTTRQFTIQILEGVDYLHQNSILHRDIKANNILMEDEKNIKLTDFGISEIIDGNGVATEKGTVRYMAPEVMYTKEGKIIYYTSRADIWSVGCTVVEMLTGKPPNSSLIPAQIAFRSVKGDPPRFQLPHTASICLQTFLERTFQRQPKLRPTADWLLKNDRFINEEIVDIF